MLDEVADIVKAHPELTRVAIEGHTDSRGDNAANKRLSQARAEAVMRYLVDKGVAADRLEARGFGEEKPLVKETADADRARNRRVDFRVAARSDGDNGAAPSPSRPAAIARKPSKRLNRRWQGATERVQRWWPKGLPPLPPLPP